MADVLPALGSIVTCRGRQWVVLPSGNQDIICLRPLSGDEDQVCGVYWPLGLDSIESAVFPPPLSRQVQDHTAALLLMNAARLSLRSGAGPFRCLGRLSVRPRPYQLVPLLMALRLETLRLLIADDVGIGKTIEAGLIARELIDRGEIRRLAVLCPPHLCDQWQRELQEKFHIDAVVVRSGTVSKLERALPAGDGHHIFNYYRYLIVSLDYAKSQQRRASFLAHCPDLVIVDEAHTCAQSGGQNTTQQQRHQLVKDLAQDPSRHLLLLTATPHSGIDASFLSILGLLRPEFAQLNLETMGEKARTELARHFVQRRRADVKHWLGSETPFPERDPHELPYRLSKAYRDLFDSVYRFARGLVRSTTQDMSYAQRRGRFWSALALVRCVMSSPAAALATLGRQVGSLTDDVGDLDEELVSAYLFDPLEQEQAVDLSPNVVVEQGQQSFIDNEKKLLRSFIQTATQLQGNADQKLQKVIEQIESLLKEGFNPIIWCRYIATAKYVAEALRDKFEKKNKNLRVVAITSDDPEDKRKAFLEELSSYSQRILVATDCLSEGINLQDQFNAVIHYDLPWNPNRLEQREGRIDRYGQTSPVVKSFLLYGQDNPVDGAVLEVLIRKAVQIHKQLGITVPVPMDSSTVAEAVFKSLFEKSADVEQLSLFDLMGPEDSPIAEVHQKWDQAVERERMSRTRFAQRAIKPEDVQQELVASDQILGSEQDVEHFVLSACERLNSSLIKKKLGWLLPAPPDPLRPVLGDKSRLITFTTPVPEGVEYIGRNHPLVEELAQYLLGEALDSNIPNPRTARCGLTITDAVTKRTTLLLLRLRHLMKSSKQESLLAEECLVVGFEGPPSQPDWLTSDQAMTLLQQAKPVEDVAAEFKQWELEELLGRLGELDPHLESLAVERAEVLGESHRRVRAITKEGQVRVKPQLPMDILGLYVLQPGRQRL